jgi:hypothetical protein
MLCARTKVQPSQCPSRFSRRIPSNEVSMNQRILQDTCSGVRCLHGHRREMGHLAPSILRNHGKVGWPHQLSLFTLSFPQPYDGMPFPIPMNQLARSSCHSGHGVPSKSHQPLMCYPYIIATISSFASIEMSDSSQENTVTP